MNIPGLGIVTMDSELGWYYSEPIAVPVLNGKVCRIAVEGYDEDPKQEDFHAAIASFLSIAPTVLQNSEPHIYRYYEDAKKDADFYGDDFVKIESPQDVWKHIDLGDEPTVSRRGYGDKGIYISLECNCDWEDEHGLQIVFKNGLIVNKIGQYDGHLTNADAFGDESLEDVVYASD